MEQQPEILPFFPLGVFLFPGEDIPLRIFEPRYKELIEDIRGSGGSFVIPFVIDEEIQEFGCEVRLENVVGENQGGRMVISVRSVSVVRVMSFSRQLEGKLYAGGAIRRMPFSEPVQSQELKSLIQRYKEDFDKEFLDCCDEPGYTRQDVMKALNLPSDDKFRFLIMPDGEHKDNYLLGQLRYLRMIRRQEHQLGNDFGLN
jgi:Lon protease-like protein